jgi:hypothetical protein
MACFGSGNTDVPHLIAVPYNRDGKPCGNCFYLLSPKEWEAFSKNPEIILSTQPLNQSPLEIVDIFNYLQDLSDQENYYPGSTPKFLNLQKLNLFRFAAYEVVLESTLASFIANLITKNLGFTEIEYILSPIYYISSILLFTLINKEFKIPSKITAATLVSPYIRACKEKGICIKDENLLSAIPFVLQNTGNLHPSGFRCTGTVSRRNKSIKILGEHIPFPNL